MPARSSQDALTARSFITRLMQLPSQRNKTVLNDERSQRIGVKMGALFATAKTFMQMPLAEMEQLLDNDYYEARMGAVCMMDFQARDKKTSPAQRKQLYSLYINRHDRINTWDMVDRGAPHVVGGYLFDKPRAILYKLARSKNSMERRTAIVSTWFFIRQNDTADTFRIAALLVHDKEELVNKAVGSWIREAGKREPASLLAFLDKHAAAMSRIALRYAMEKLNKKQKSHYLQVAKETIS